MENIIDNGFTLYISKGNAGFIGIGLRKLENGMGIEPIEIKKEILNVLEQLPTITKKLENGNTLQMYRYGYAYFMQLGKTFKEGPYGEKDCFEVTSESTNFTLSDTLTDLEEVSKQEENFSGPSLRKKYRLYGSDKYE